MPRKRQRCFAKQMKKYGQYVKGTNSIKDKNGVVKVDEVVVWKGGRNTLRNYLIVRVKASLNDGAVEGSLNVLTE